jgi:P27 family predicted phage terminase small subunit
LYGLLVWPWGFLKGIGTLLFLVLADGCWGLCFGNTWTIILIDRRNERGSVMARGRKPVLTSAPGKPEESEVLTPPDGMTSRALEKWHVVVPLIAQQCALKEHDIDALRQYCEAFALYCKANKEMDEGPLIHTTTNGSLQTSPLLKIVKQCEATMMKLSERFGLDPSSRQRLKIASKVGGNASAEFMGFLNRGKRNGK